MNIQIKSFVFVSLPAALFYLLFGWLVFDLLLGPFTEANTTHLLGFKKNEQAFNYLFLSLSCLAYAILINYFQSKSNNSASAKNAFLNAAFIGVLIACMTDFYWFASSHFYLNFIAVIVDILGAAISVGLLGVITFFLRKLVHRT